MFHCCPLSFSLPETVTILVFSCKSVFHTILDCFSNLFLLETTTFSISKGTDTATQAMTPVPCHASIHLKGEGLKERGRQSEKKRFKIFGKI